MNMNMKKRSSAENFGRIMKGYRAHPETGMWYTLRTFCTFIATIKLRVYRIWQN